MDYYKHIQEKRNIKVNTKEYDDWLEILLKFDTENIPLEHLWVDCDIYYLFLAKQRTDLWKNGRIGRVTGSVLAEACNSSEYGNTNSIIRSIDDINKPMIDLNITSEHINGLKTKTFNDFAVKAMQHGTDTEPFIREYHSKTVNVDILELPMAIPKSNLNIGVSIDAYLKYTNVIGEYKAVQKMYPKLQKRIQNNSKVLDYSHIKKDHYYQMHLGMYVFDKAFCDYIVYDNINTNTVYLERIPFNKDFFDNTLYVQLTHFIDNYLIPKRPENYPLNPPRQL